MKIKVGLGAKELVELGRIRCGRGQILRRSFRRSDGVLVRASCVKDQGAPGRTPAEKRVLPQPRPGSLKGWKADSGANARHAALKKAVKAEGCKSVILRLNLEANFTEKTSPKTHRKARQDMDYLRNQDWCKLKSKKR